MLSATYYQIRKKKLDANIKKIVLPFNIMLTAFNSSKYNISNGYMTPCRIKYHLSFFVIILFLNTLSFINVYHLASKSVEAAIFIRIDFPFYLPFYAFNYLLLMICNIIHSSDNIFLVLKVQEIHRKCDIRKSFRYFIVCNWISVLLVAPLVFSCFVFLSLYFDLNLFELWCGFLMISYNLNVVYATRLMVLLRMYLAAWIEQIKNIERSGQGDLNIWREMFNVYQNILKAYENYKICFRVLVSECLNQHVSRFTFFFFL